MSRALRALPRVFITFVVVAVVSVLASPAEADTVRIGDPRGDVQTYVSQDGVSSRHKVVDRPSLDLTGFRVTYDRTRIRALLRYDDLAYSPYVMYWSTLYFYHRAPGSDVYTRGTVELFTSRSYQGGYTYTSFEEFGRTCKANHKVDYQRDQVAISIPSSCINNLDEVLVSVDSWQSARSNSGRFFYDVAPDEDRSAVPVARAAS